MQYATNTVIIKCGLLCERVSCLKVSLIAHTVLPEKLVAASAKLCYSASGVDTLMDGLNEEKTAAFVDMLSEIGHESPIEHASFTFGIEGVSRSLLAQLTRHRMASYSVQSQRYVTANQFEYVLPPEIAAIPEAAEEYRRAMEEDQAHYDRLTAILKEKHLVRNLEKGMSEKDAARAAEKQAIEDARFVLPNACTTKIVMTMNARSLHNFFRHRCCNRAQWEIRALAEDMYKLCVDAAPHLFKHAGPPCVCGGCPEGKMSCGKVTEMRDHYRELREKKES